MVRSADVIAVKGLRKEYQTPLGRAYSADLPINSGMPEIAAALAELRPASTPPWSADTAAARCDYVAWNALVQVEVAPGVPALLELRLPEEIISPTTTLSAIREQALRRRGGAKEP